MHQRLLVLFSALTIGLQCEVAGAVDMFFNTVSEKTILEVQSQGSGKGFRVPEDGKVDFFEKAAEKDPNERPSQILDEAKCHLEFDPTLSGQKAMLSLGEKSSKRTLGFSKPALNYLNSETFNASYVRTQSVDIRKIPDGKTLKDAVGGWKYFNDIDGDAYVAHHYEYRIPLTDSGHQIKAFVCSVKLITGPKDVRPNLNAADLDKRIPTSDMIEKFESTFLGGGKVKVVTGDKVFTSDPLVVEIPTKGKKCHGSSC